MQLPSGPCVAASLGLAALLASNGNGPASQESWVRPDVSTYDAIDRALDEQILIASDAIWRVFPGVEEPSPDMEWTAADFDDSAWPTGTGPFGFGHGETNGDGDEPPPFTTLYLRGVLELQDPDVYATIDLVLPIDDGYIAYVNGEDEGRLNAGFHGRRAFDETATYARDVEVEPVPRVDLTRKLSPGRNQLAIQVLANADDADSLEARPFVQAALRRGPEEDRARYETLAALLEDPADEGRAAYLEGPLPAAHRRPRGGRPSASSRRPSWTRPPALPGPGWRRRAGPPGRRPTWRVFLRRRHAAGTYTRAVPRRLDRAVPRPRGFGHPAT